MAAAAAAKASAAECAAAQQQLEAKSAELEAARADAALAHEAHAEAAAARDKTAAECSEHAEYSESIEGARQARCHIALAVGPPLLRLLVSRLTRLHSDGA